MKFLADMGISNLTVTWLREQGYDAVHLREENLHRLPDDEIMAKAKREGRIVLTLDLDFGYLLATSGEGLPSVIIFRLTNKSAESINKKLADILAQRGEEVANGAVISVGDHAYRLRHLPIEN